MGKKPFSDIDASLFSARILPESVPWLAANNKTKEAVKALETFKRKRQKIDFEAILIKQSEVGVTESLVSPDLVRGEEKEINGLNGGIINEDSVKGSSNMIHKHSFNIMNLVHEKNGYFKP